MSTTTKQKTDYVALMHDLGPAFAARTVENDADDRFVADNYKTLKEHRIFSVLIPEELGGGGATHTEACAMLRTLAGYCCSTALSVSMHTHLVAANVWKYRNKGEAGPMLQSVAEKQLVLVSTGARDWLDSNGTVEKVDGGYRVSSKKAFASGCPAGDVLVTSAPYEDPEAGWQVLHFPVPMQSEGVHVGDDWRVMGMRATGSNTVTLDKVFVPDEAIVLRRPQGVFHPFWSTVLTVALPLISSVYLGIADRAAAIAVEHARKKPFDTSVALLLGELENERAQADMAVATMMPLVNEYDFMPDDTRSRDILVRKTQAVQAAIRTVTKAMEIVGAMAYRREHELERLFRDVQAGEFHPLSKQKQYLFTGRVAMGLDPISDA